MSILSRSGLRQRLPALLQRAPIMTHLGMIPFAFFGAKQIPLLFAIVIIAIHCMLLCVNIRSLLGCFAGWRGVKKHSSTDWRAVHAATRDADSLDFESVEHMIFCPNYAEDISVLRETLYLLSTQPLARKCYHPVLGMEAREAGAVQKAQQLIAEFRGAFKDLGYTLHPGGIPGEAAGKSSNLSWSMRQAYEEMREKGEFERIARTVVTIIDSDTALAGDYFTAISCKFALRTPAERERMYFVPPICFDRNASDVPITVRITDIMWAIAGLSSIIEWSGAKIPTSAYSLSLSLASSVGFHDVSYQAIGEDMHMFIKCLFATGGNVISETIYSPASNLDVVSGDREGLRGYWNDNVARYKQAIRHMWGSLDSGYVLTRLINSDYSVVSDNDTQDRAPFPTVFTSQPEALLGLEPIPEELPMRKLSIRPTFAEQDFGTPTPTDSSVSSSSASVISLDDAASETSLSDAEEMAEKAALRVQERLAHRTGPFMSLLMRMYEAHFLMGHMLLLLGLREITGSRLPGPSSWLVPLPTLALLNDGPRLVDWAWRLTDLIRFVTTIGLVMVFCCYDLYHQQSVKYRWQNNKDNMGAQSSSRSERKLPLSIFQYLAAPAGIAFGIAPLLQAQFCHIFTDKLVYTVSFKPKGSDHRAEAEKSMA